MDLQQYPQRSFLNYSHRAAAMGLGPQSFNFFPEAGNSQPEFDDIHIFENQIPEDDLNSKASKVNSQYLYPAVNTTVHGRVVDRALIGSAPVVHQRSLKRSLFWPIVVVIIPVTLLAATLLLLVYVFKVKTDVDLFQRPVNGGGSRANSSYILVNYSATRLVFMASFLSSIAPILASFVMSLWTLPVAETMRMASLKTHSARLPTPYQLSLVIGITLASYDRLWRYLGMLFSRSGASIPRALHQAALMLILTTFLALAVFISDTALHYSTQTVPFSKIKMIAQPDLEYGRGLNELCLTLDRIENGGFPCSYDILGTDPNAVAELNEAFYLHHNDSSVSEIAYVHDGSLEHGDLAILTTQSMSLAPDIDYLASTIGVSSQCRPITTQCDMRVDETNDYHTLFNCSDNFWGVLGDAPNPSQNFEKATDPNSPGLAYKPAQNIEYAFFEDSGLNFSYNPVGWNATGQQGFPPLKDSQLINPIYFGFAGRISFGSESAGSPINTDNEIYIAPNTTNGFADFALSCSLTSYDVEFAWVNGSIQNTTFTPTKNGSVLEIFHGYQFYVTLTSGAWDLQDYLLQVALQNTTDALAREFGNLYSAKILSMIGGYTSPRTNIAQQERSNLLVASVPKAALGALIACSLAYTVLGFCLGIAAYRASVTEVQEFAEQLSLGGLTAAAFGDKSMSPSTAGAEMKYTRTFTQGLPTEETRWKDVDGSSQQGFGYKTWV